MTADKLAQAVASAVQRELDSALDRLRHCLDQLNEQQVWWRPRPEMNSIGNLLLHVCGNLRQWIVAGIGGAVDDRRRAAEFSEQGPIPKSELLRRLSEVVHEAKQVLARASASELVRHRTIQGFDVTGLEAIFDSVPHFRGHVQEIVHMTRLQLGEQYRFAWTPTTPEQGA